MGKHNIGETSFSLDGRENKLLAIEQLNHNDSKFEIHDQLIVWLCKYL